MTIKVAVEYPSGVFTAAQTQTVAAGDKSSMTFNVAIPEGAMFWIVNNKECALGIITTQSPFVPNISTTQRDACRVGTAVLPDITAGGVSLETGYAECYYPCAIVGLSAKPAVFMVGDSTCQGSRLEIVTQNTSVPWTMLDDSGDTGYLPPSIGSFMGYANYGVSGTQAQGFTSANASRRIALINLYGTHLFIAPFGINDFVVGGRTAVQLIADLTRIVALFPTKKRGILTITPRSTNATTVDSVNNPKVVAANKVIRGGIVGASIVYDVSDAVSSDRDSGLWMGEFTTDFLHGYTVKCRNWLKQSGAINPALIFNTLNT